MRFLFIASGVLPLHHRSLDERPLGGTETGVIRLAAALSDLGHEVTVCTRHPNPPLTKPLYLPMSAVYDVGPVDVLITVRDWMPLTTPIPAVKRLFWTGDATDQPSTVGLGDPRVVAAMTAMVAVSEWQAQTFHEQVKIPRDKIWCIGNGVHLPYFSGGERRERHRLIYTSTPYRGLVHLERLFPRIRAAEPRAELVVCSDYRVYAEREGEAPIGYTEEVAKFEILRQRLSAIEGVTVPGTMKQAALATELKRSAILVYPNIFSETSCIAVLEAKAAGCAVVTSRRAALVESVGGAGILIDGVPGRGSYDDDFVRASLSLLADDELFESYSRQAQFEASGSGWSAVAERLLAKLAG